MGNVDIRPDLCSEGGGLADDFDGIISDMRFIMTDYDGALDEPVPVARVVFDIDGEEEVALYSVGGKGDFAPDETGFGLTKLKSKAALTKRCKLVMLLNSIVEAGFPLNKLDARDVSSVVGLNGHFLRKPVEYKGFAKKDGDRENTVLLCTAVNQLPWDAPKGKGKAAKGKKAAKVDEGMADDLAVIIQGIIIENDGNVAKKNMLSALLKSDEVKERDDKQALLKLANDDSYLEGRDEWSIEGGVLTME